MIAILSPSKTLREIPSPVETTKPKFDRDARKLAQVMKTVDIPGLMKLMKISEKLAVLNFERYQYFKKSPAYAAGWLFYGDVFESLAIDDFSQADIDYAQDHLRILSGLYGLLRIRDGIKPYRLEMGSKLETDRGKNLYDYWGDRLMKSLAKEAKGQVIVNLASQEYNKAARLDQIGGQVLDVSFLEIRQGIAKGIPLFSKKARGLMARFMVKEKAKEKEDLKSFDYEGYAFSEERSDETSYVFIR